MTYPIADTMQTEFYSDSMKIDEPLEGDPFYGQDATYSFNTPSYKDNGDHTVTDLVTGLMWQQTMEPKMTYEEAVRYASECKLGGYDDWRIPTIKELFSLIIYTGNSGGETAGNLFIDTEYFDQPIGDISIGEREIDAQVWSTTWYLGKTMNNDDTIFGVNFIDGRIKGYPAEKQNGEANRMYFRLVRGNELYGINQLKDNGDGTVSDLATGLMWQQSDDGNRRNWEQALSYCESLTLAGYDDWFLPDIKQLQSIADYDHLLPAVNENFILTKIKDPAGKDNFGFYWSSTTHLDGMNPYDSACYIAFGKAQGKMNGMLVDVHGAGAVRSDPKNGDEADYPQYFGPQGDIRYVYNFVLAVRVDDSVIK
ncbi:MAG: DUF1566 domain-containing protein [Clostridia bacterium]|nr:DUF1566 domain-containing protein [Clostridia bacterium]